MSAHLPPRPIDATLSVTKAARLLGVELPGAEAPPLLEALAGAG